MVRPKHQQPMNNQISNQINNHNKSLWKPRKYWAQAIRKMDQQPDQNQPNC